MEGMLIRRLWLRAMTVLLMLSVVRVASGASLLLTDAPHGQLLSDQVSVLIDPTQAITIDQAARAGAAFQPLKGAASFGLDSRAYWFRFSARQSGKQARDWWLEIPQPWLDDVRLYAPKPGGGFQEVRAGDHWPSDQWAVPYRHFILPFTLSGDAPTTLYLRVQTSGSLTVPLVVWQPPRLAAAIQTDSGLQSLYYGVMAILVLYNLFLLASFRDWLFAQYALTALFGWFTVLAVNGQASEAWWSGSPWLADRLVLIIPAVWCLFGLRYMQRLLDLARQAPRFNIVVYFAEGYAVLTALLAGVIEQHWAIVMVNIAAPLSVSVGLACAIRTLFNRYAPSVFILLGYAFLLAGALGIAARNLGGGPLHLWVHNALQIGTTVESILLAFALAVRIRMTQQEGERALQQAFLQQISQLRFQESSVAVLEERIQARSRELEAKESRLQQEVAMRRTLEADLRASEELLRQVAYQDVLTGLPNRSRLADEFDRLRSVGRSPQTPMLLLAVVDGLDAVEVRLGTPACEELLQQVAQRLREVAAACGGVPGRLDRDRFALLLTDTPVDDVTATSVMEAMQGRLSAPYPLAAGDAELGVRVGQAGPISQIGTLDSLVRLALEETETQRAPDNRRAPASAR